MLQASRGARLSAPTSDSRHLSRWHAAALVAGSMIGVGIFLTPRIAAAAVGTGPWFFALWFLGAVVALAGALAVAELGAMLPHAGGDYVYLREAYGDFSAFLYGWLSLLASFSGAIAAMAVGIPRYQGPLFIGERAHAPLLHLPFLTLHVDQLLGMALVWLLTGLACLRVRVAGRTQLGLTASVMALLLAGALWAIATGVRVPNAHAAASALDRGEWLPILLAFSAVYFAYSGWNTAGYVASEITRPEKHLPWALLVATLSVGALYLVLCVAFTVTLPDLSQAFEAGSATATVLFGAVGGTAMAALIGLAVTGATLATMVAGSRIYFAMARDGLFFAAVGRLHPRLGTPVLSLCLQAVWVTILIASGTFEDLLRWATLAIILLSVLTALAVPVLRWRRPDATRPFRQWGYPWTTVAYVLPCLAVLGASAWDKPGEAAVGAGIIGVGWLSYRLRPKRISA